jgi:hypothetical protein
MFPFITYAADGSGTHINGAGTAVPPLAFAAPVAGPACQPAAAGAAAAVHQRTANNAADAGLTPSRTWRNCIYWEHLEPAPPDENAFRRINEVSPWRGLCLFVCQHTRRRRRVS